MAIEEVRSFAASAVRDIERNHGVVFDSFEVSLARLLAAERPFWHIIRFIGPDVMNLVSRSTQIAIFPQPADFYVPESNNLSLDQQRELLVVNEAEVIKKRRRIGGLRLTMGDVATHAGLVFAYFDKTGGVNLHEGDYGYRSDRSSGGVRLHGVDYNNRYTRTETPTVGSKVAVVGDFVRIGGLGVGECPAGTGFQDVWAIYLGVPVQE